MSSQANPGTVGSGTTTVSAASTATQLTATPSIARVLLLHALSANGADVWIGASGMAVEDGFPLAAGDDLRLELVNPSTLYFTSTDDAAKLAWLKVDK